MAAGPAIEARWNKKGIELADRTEVWENGSILFGSSIWLTIF